jgi:hypothetical protein
MAKDVRNYISRQNTKQYNVKLEKETMNTSNVLWGDKFKK